MSIFKHIDITLARPYTTGMVRRGCASSEAVIQDALEKGISYREKPTKGLLALNVINHLGDERVKVFYV